MFDRNAEVLGQEARKARSVRHTIGRFWAYFRHYKWTLLIVLFLVIINTAIQAIVPILIGQTIDCALASTLEQSSTNCFLIDKIPTTTTDRLRILAVLAGSVALGYIVSGTIASQMFYTFSIAGYKVLDDMRQDVFAQIHRLPLGYFSKMSSGNIMSRVTNDIDTLQQIIGFSLLSVLQGFLLITFIIIAMFRTSIPYALITLIILPVMVVVTWWLSRQARQAFRVARQEIGEVNADLQENIAAVREVQAFNREDENIAQFREQNKANRDANIRAQAFSSALGPALDALGFVSVAIVVGVGGWALIRNEGNFFGTAVSAGLIITFVQYTQQFNFPVQQIATLWANIQSAIAGGERIFELIDEPPELVDKANAKFMPEITGRVQFNNVWAEYNEGDPVLKGVTIDAKVGDTVAIVGPTGAGKTTILNLLPRFWDTTSGELLIDGINVSDVERGSLRKQIGMVLQDTFLFSNSIIENIRFGQPDATDEDVISAAKLAHADSFITQLPDGYNTILGERGGGLSQGQRQLLSIARVILSNPRILILDEATSSVDTRTEQKIQTAFDKLLVGRTSFVVAHRLSTIRNADQVIVLQDGQVTEQGTHDSLLAKNGFYKELYESQFKRSKQAE